MNYPKELAICNAENGYRNIIAVSHLNSLRRIPWENDVAFFLVSFLDPDAREPVCVCPRGLLKKVIAKAEVAGYPAIVGSMLHGNPPSSSECEFSHFPIPSDCSSPERAASAITSFLQNNSIDSLPALTEGMFGSLITQPLHNEDCHDVILDACEQFRCDIEEWHAESGPGAFKAALQFGEVKDMADKAGLFKRYVVKAFGIKHGITPCFMAKPRHGLPGNSGHMHITLVTMDGKDAFTRDTPDPSPPYPDVAHSSDLGRQFLAGLLTSLPDIMPLFAPTMNSYRRLVEDFCTPTTVSGVAHFEIHVPDADANPHFGLAAIIALGGRGVEKKLEIPVPPLSKGENMSGASNKGVRLAKSLKKQSN
ncbi:hypothetical protein BDV38DRAFT_289028 [Aspergillus pseudotamarii]|uniref:GS catalytic domain-containing protein n=1 Tax=Aspergillus pseudotamarii TaxID=132259 RepID=A0A5N6SBP2_ASPPS|nr:uncharacterized protein BDV38DRAFT_289028 [Aspergillus pseudotamarii]KAE8131081.1 hypothetical protein BDV38DRAFT_289028 [Aspergillus pseudotamarii]